MSCAKAWLIVKLRLVCTLQASVEDAADLQNHGNAAKKSRKGAKDKDKEKERAKEKEKEEAKVAKEKERAGRKEAVATAAAAVMAAAQVAAEPAQAAVKAAPKGISIVNRAKFVPKGGSYDAYASPGVSAPVHGKGICR